MASSLPMTLRAYRKLSAAAVPLTPVLFRRRLKQGKEDPARINERERRIIEEESSKMTEYSYTVLFEPAEEGGFVVTCPALPGLVTEGDTLEEARAMAEDAIRGYIESLRKEPVKEEIRVLVSETS